MKTGTILRGYNFIEDDEILELENSTKELAENLIKETKFNLDTMFNKATEQFHSELNKVEEYKRDFEKEYNKQVNQYKEQAQKLLNDIEEEYSRLASSLEQSFEEYLKNTKNEIKDIMLILFRNFFSSEYQNMDNIESLITHSLEQLKESKDIKISLNKECFTKFTSEKKDLLNTLLDSNIDINSHSSKSLICELNSAKGNIEIDFDKQMDKIRETISIFG